MAFATADDLAARLGLTFTDAEQTRASTLLDMATGLIQDEAKQTIELVTDDVLTMPGTTAERILLPERPVVSVFSVTLDGQPLGDGTDWYLDGNEIVRRPFILSAPWVFDQGFTFPYGSGFGWAGQTLEITYTHGYTDVPAVCAQIALEMVVAVWVNPNNIARETIAGVQTVYDNMRYSPTGLLMTDAQIRMIRRKFGRAGSSVTVLGG